MYIPELDRIVLKDSTSKRPFASTQTCRWGWWGGQGEMGGKMVCMVHQGGVLSPHSAFPQPLGWTVQLPVLMSLRA